MKDIFDDKTLIVISLTIIVVTAMIIFDKNSVNIVNNIVSVCLGIAIGKRI